MREDGISNDELHRKHKMVKQKISWEDRNKIELKYNTF